MRITFRPILAALAMLVVAAPAAAAQATMKIAYVNSRQLLAEAPGADQAQQMFEREMNGYQQQVQQLGDSLQAAIQRFQRDAREMQPARRDSIAETLERQQMAYQQRVAELEQQAQQREMQLAQPIMQNIQRVLADVRRDEGYHFILDIAAQGSPVVAADTTLDITDRVLTRLKALPAPTFPAAVGSTQPSAPPARTGPVAQPAGVRRPPSPQR